MIEILKRFSTLLIKKMQTKVSMEYFIKVKTSDRKVGVLEQELHLSVWE